MQSPKTRTKSQTRIEIKNINEDEELKMQKN
jgi:hypothetical protein